MICQLRHIPVYYVFYIAEIENTNILVNNIKNTGMQKIAGVMRVVPPSSYRPIKEHTNIEWLLMDQIKSARFQTNFSKCFRYGDIKTQTFRKIDKRSIFE